MSSPMKPLERLHIAKTRSRSDTSSLLSDSFDPDANVECPVPESEISLYTRERLQKSLIYARKFLSRRNISPRSELFMHFFKNEIKNALITNTKEEIKTSTIMIMVQEKLINENFFLKPLSANKEMEENLLALRESQYYQRYGDYMKIIPTRLRIHASKEKTENWESISGRHYWSDIAKELDAEDIAWKKSKQTIRGSNSGRVNLSTFRAVHLACVDLGISQELVIWSIMKYAKRNEQAHHNLNTLRETGEFSTLAKVLCADRDELSCTFSEISNETDLDRLKDVIQHEIDTWFDTSVDPTYPQVWSPKPALIQAFKDAKEKAKKPSNHAMKEVNIAKEKERAAKKLARQDETASAGSSTSPKKRVASTEEPRGSATEKEDRKTKQKFALLARKCKLEAELKRVQSDLDKLEESTSS